MRTLRTRQWQGRLRSRGERVALALWAAMATRPRLYAFTTRLVARLLGLVAGNKGRITWLPFGSGWTRVRDLPAPGGRTFRDLYRERGAR